MCKARSLLRHRVKAVISGSHGQGYCIPYPPRTPSVKRGGVCQVISKPDTLPRVAGKFTGSLLAGCRDMDLAGDKITRPRESGDLYVCSQGNLTTMLGRRISVLPLGTCAVPTYVTPRTEWYDW